MAKKPKKQAPANSKLAAGLHQAATPTKTAVGGGIVSRIKGLADGPIYRPPGSLLKKPKGAKK